MKYTTKHIDNYVIIVSDEKPKVGDCYIVTLYDIEHKASEHIELCISINEVWVNNISVESTRHINNCKKIIAQSKPIHPNIPVFDIPVEWGVDVEKLADRSSEIQEATYTTQHKVTYTHGFIDGYNKRAETHLFTMEDMMNIAGWMAAADYKRPIPELNQEAEEYIKNLLKPQEYEVEISTVEDGKVKIIKWEKIV